MLPPAYGLGGIFKTSVTVFHNTADPKPNNKATPTPTLAIPHENHANFLYVSIMMGKEIRLTAIQIPELCYQNGTPKAAKEAYDIEDAWNPVCCHGNKFVTLRKIVFSILIKIWSSVWRHDFVNLRV